MSFSKKINLNMDSSWKDQLADEFQKDYYLKLSQFLETEKSHYQIYPPSDLVFEAFKLTPFDKVKVVILGQDPYHGEGQAHGLSFSVPNEEKTPPSLRNIFKELSNDIGIEIPKNTCLDSWAKQGVMLLNATLTVRAKTPGSHQNQGWEEFTDEVIRKLSSLRDNLVFILWGNYAQNKGGLIDSSKHLVIKSAHPSPFSAHRGFLGSQPFSTTNDYLNKVGKAEIDWRL